MGKTLLRRLLLAGGFALVLTSVFGCAQNSGANTDENPSYFGREANEGEFNFESTIYITKSNGVPSESEVYQNVKEAIRYTLGAMHEEASIYGGFKVKTLKTEISSANTYKVSYRFDGKGVFNLYTSNYKLIVPVVPYRLLELSKNKCHNVQEDIDDGNFWYAWNPNLPECPLLEGVHYNKIHIELSIVGQTRLSYPEYERLLVNKQLNATIFFGADHNNENWNPLTKGNEDPGAASYKDFRDYLIKKLGYVSRTMSPQEIEPYYNPKNKNKIPFAEEISKTTSRGIIRYRLFYLETQYIEDGSEAFHYILKNTLKNESVVFYEGHSGIGRNLNLSHIERRHNFEFNFNPNYQIMLLGSCIPYAYYVDLLFKRKSTELDPKGSKNLDIFAYGLEAQFGSTEHFNVMLALDKYMTTGRQMSYQEIITEHPKFYFGVLGDEDNLNSR